MEPDDLFRWVDECRMAGIQKSLLEAVLCNTYWVIWRFRNDVVHGARKMRKDNLFDYIREFSFLWVSNRFKKRSITWNVWLQNLFSIV